VGVLVTFLQHQVREAWRVRIGLLADAIIKEPSFVKQALLIRQLAQSHADANKAVFAAGGFK
jgi:hypothetical protein